MKSSELVKLFCRVNPDTHKVEARVFYLQDTLEGKDIKDIVHQLHTKHKNLDWQALEYAMRDGHQQGFQNDTLAWFCGAYFNQPEPKE